MIVPFDEGFAQQQASRVHRLACWSSSSARRSVSVGENFRFGHGASGDAALLAADAALRDAGRAAGRGRRRDRLLDADPRAGGRRARSSRRRACWARRSGSAVRSSAATSADASSASRPRTWFPTPSSGLPRRTASTPAASGERLAAVNVGVRPTFGDGLAAAGRGVSARFQRRPLRPGADGRVRRAAARRGSGSTSVDALIEQMRPRRRSARANC